MVFLVTDFEYSLDCYLNESLEKYDEDVQSLPIGYKHNDNRREVQTLHTGYKAWFLTPQQGKIEEQNINSKFNHYLDKVPDTHKQTMTSFSNLIMKDKRRHAIPGYHIDSRGQQAWAPRARHIKHMVNNDPNVNVNYNPDNSMDFTIKSRHGEDTRGMSWNYHPEKGLRFMGKLDNVPGFKKSENSSLMNKIKEAFFQEKVEVEIDIHFIIDEYTGESWIM